MTLKGLQICYRQDTPAVLIFFTHSGYSREEILGCNCRFLSGPGTSVEVLEEVRDQDFMAFLIAFSL